ncbi:MAG: cytochrome c-type biogenesis protein CcmH [Gammaproteobacteria bacterium]|nr:cytochrome c-type biogenesis protein CcmH [Gammaproteobacteria bacterium]
MSRLISLLMLVALSGTVLAIDNQEALEDSALQARYVRLGNELRCLVCQNQSIADSTAGLAADLRAQVREMLLDGASDQEILDYMVARYGDFVRYRPAFNIRTWALWLGPFVVVLIGLAVVATVIRRNANLDPEQPDI